MIPSLFDDTGKPLRLSTRIGKGGEGEVFAIEGQDLVVKFYTIKDIRTRELKVRRMLADELAKKYPLVAFPKSVVLDQSRRFAGFAMAKVSDHKPFHELYSPASRKVEFPQANYRFLALSAANIARAIAAAHAANCIVGDINHSGILVSSNATVTLIDADSFQVTDGGTVLHCLVGVPEYTPPELQGKTLATTTRTANHDAFGLAIAIFQLLFMGRHPFSGRYSGGDMPLEKAITEFRFAYSNTRSVGMSPPPGVPTLKDFPAAIGQAFEAAFAPSGVTNRPPPRQWIALLDELKDYLRTCSENRLHQYPSAATECPWCRMEKRFCVPLFLPVFAVDNLHAMASAVVGDSQQIWRAIEAVPLPLAKAFPQYGGPVVEPSIEVVAIRKQRRTKRTIGWILAVTAAGLPLIEPQTVLLALGMGGVVWYLFTSKTEANRDIERAYKVVQTKLYEAEAEWDRNNSGTEFADLKTVLQKKKDEFDGLPMLERMELNKYQDNRKSAQLDQYLRSQLIRNYKISGIGDSRRATLLSHNIETAADVQERAVLDVPGFGPATAQPLLSWRRNVESRFVYNPAETPQDRAAIGRIKSEIAQKASRLKGELSLGPATLTQLAAAISAKQSANIPFIEMMLKQRAQLVANLEGIGVSLPRVDRPMLKTTSAPPAQPSFAAASVPMPGAQPMRCPKCGGNMVIRLAQKGPNRGNRFYGCTRYPACNGTRSFL